MSEKTLSNNSSVPTDLRDISYDTHLIEDQMDPLISDSITCLKQGIFLLRKLSQSEYTHRQVDCFGSSIGGHFRHNIDHYLSFLKGIDTGSIDYDARLRDASIESQIAVAIEHHEKIIEALATLADEQMLGAVPVKMDCGSDEAIYATSSFRREIQFLLSHTVHHYALIAVICFRIGVEMPKGFGVAPSTLKFREGADVSCAQ